MFVQAMPLLAGRLRASLTCLGSGCSSVVCKSCLPPTQTTPSRTVTIHDSGEHLVNFRWVNSHHGLLQGDSRSTGQGIQGPVFLSPRCHSFFEWLCNLGQVTSVHLFPYRMELILPPSWVRTNLTDWICVSRENAFEKIESQE